MRLSFGAVRGESLLCPYHGWTFNTAGQCFHMPAHPDTQPPKAACAQRFKVTESSGYVWINAGTDSVAPEVTVAPPAALPVVESVRTLYLPCSIDVALAALLSFPLHAWTQVRTGAVVTPRADRPQADAKLVFDGRLDSTDAAAGRFVATIDATGLAVEFDAGPGEPRYGMRLFPCMPDLCGVHVHVAAPAGSALRDRLNRAVVALRHAFNEGALPASHAHALAAIQAARLRNGQTAHADNPSDEASRCTL